MKLVYYALLFNLFVIFLFSLIYYILPDEHFVNINNKSTPLTYMDCISLSTTIQAGVGITNTIPSNLMSKLAVMCQQFILISSNALILYLFIKHHTRKHKYRNN